MAEGEISIRLMSMAEAPLAAAILESSVRALWRGHLSEAVIEGVVRANTAAEIVKRGERQEDYLAWLDGRAAGYLGLKRNEIGILFIAADAVGKGVGRALSEFADRCLRRRGHKTAVVYASPTALGFYEKQGFRRTGQNVSFEVGPGAFIPAVFMEKDLWPQAGAAPPGPAAADSAQSLAPPRPVPAY